MLNLVTLVPTNLNHEFNILVTKKVRFGKMKKYVRHLVPTWKASVPK